VARSSKRKAVEQKARRRGEVVGPTNDRNAKGKVVGPQFPTGRVLDTGRPRRRVAVEQSKKARAADLGGPVSELDPNEQRRAMARMFPGLYGDVPVEQRAARAVVQEPTGENGSVPWQEWPVPCPDAFCEGDPTYGVTDPVSGQQHHYRCAFWDRTGRVPF
jgi:hypothetical protein